MLKLKYGLTSGSTTAEADLDLRAGPTNFTTDALRLRSRSCGSSGFVKEMIPTGGPAL